MNKKGEGSYFLLVAVVAIVAVAGIVVMMLGVKAPAADVSGKAGVATGNLAGEAISPDSTVKIKKTMLDMFNNDCQMAGFSFGLEQQYGNGDGYASGEEVCDAYEQILTDIGEEELHCVIAHPVYPYDGNVYGGIMSCKEIVKLENFADNQFDAWNLNTLCCIIR